MQCVSEDIIHGTKVLPNKVVIDNHNIEECCKFISAIADRYKGMCNDNHPLLSVKRKLKEIDKAFRTPLNHFNGDR